jgi:hypothetical protein
MRALNFFLAANVSVIAVMGLVACQGVSGESDTVARPPLAQEQSDTMQIARCAQEPDEEAPEVGQRLEFVLNVVMKDGRAAEVDGDLKVTDESQTVSSAVLGRIASIKAKSDVRIISLAKAKQGNEADLPAEKISLHTGLNTLTIAMVGGEVREVTGCVFKNLSVLSNSLR